MKLESKVRYIITGLMIFSVKVMEKKSAMRRSRRRIRNKINKTEKCNLKTVWKIRLRFDMVYANDLTNWDDRNPIEIQHICSSLKDKRLECLISRLCHLCSV